jgi:hypothetical protein
MTLTGRVVYRDVEGGVWVLEGDDGRTYQLAGGDRKIKKEGQRVEVHGDVDSQVMTIFMSGPVFNVSSYRFI